jgi:hypothetical protein
MKYIELLLGWLFPGTCYLLKKDWARGSIIFLLLHMTFLIGILLQGGVLWPVWNPTQEGFNLINILTFTTQIGEGALALISTLTDWAHLNIISIDLSKASFLRFFHGNETSSTFELGSFYLLVTGAMNYFALVGFYDRYYSHSDHKAPRAKRESE